MKKLIIALTLLAVLTGCVFFTGEKDGVDPKTGKPKYKEAPFVELSTLVGGLFGMGAGAGALARLGRNAARAKEGLMDANEDAIENADWKQINSKESFKELLALAQASHKDAKVIEKEYRKWKTKKEKKG